MLKLVYLRLSGSNVLKSAGTVLCLHMENPTDPESWYNSRVTGKRAQYKTQNIQGADSSPAAAFLRTLSGHLESSAAGSFSPTAVLALVSIY